MKEKNRAVTSVTIELHKNDNSLHLNSIDIKELNTVAISVTLKVHIKGV